MHIVIPRPAVQALLAKVRGRAVGGTLCAAVAALVGAAVHPSSRVMRAADSKTAGEPIQSEAGRLRSRDILTLSSGSDSLMRAPPAPPPISSQVPPHAVMRALDHSTAT